jgi:hypothetical protein
MATWSSTGGGRLTGNGDLLWAGALGKGYGQLHRTPMSGAWAMKKPSQTSKGKLHLAAARCGSSSFRGTKHLSAGFKIVVAENSTRQVGLTKV